MSNGYSVQFQTNAGITGTLDGTFQGVEDMLTAINGQTPLHSINRGQGWQAPIVNIKMTINRAGGSQPIKQKPLLSNPNPDFPRMPATARRPVAIANAQIPISNGQKQKPLPRPTMDFAKK